MSYALNIDETLGCALVRWHGSVGRGDLLAYMHALEEHPEFRQGLNRLHDFRRAEVILSDTEVRNTAEAFDRNYDLHGAHEAVILVDADMSFGLSRIYEALRNQPGTTLHVTRNLDQAKTILELPAEPADPFEGMAPD